MQTKRIESLVKTTLNQQNEYYKLTDEYDQSFMVQVQRLKIKEETLASTLKIISETIFSDGPGFHHVVVLLGFCTQLDKHCKMQHGWYTQEKLVDIIVNILYDVNFIPPSPGLFRCVQ